jgi:hypothetical protein
MGRPRYGARVSRSMDADREELGVDAPRSAHWRKLANCAGENTEAFFSDNPAYAKKVCAACPVTVQCLNTHLFEPHGVFGGMTPDDRKNYRRNIRRRTK